MPFQDALAGTSGDPLDGRSGWSLLGAEGLFVYEISGSNVDIRVFANGGGSGSTAYQCTDQSNADHYTQAKVVALASSSSSYIAVRLVDKDNAVGVRFAGTGATGIRLSKLIAGVNTDLTAGTSPNMQGVTGDSYRVSVTGDQYSLWYDSGSTGSFTQSGSDQTVINAEISTAETTQGLISGTTGGLRLDDFEAGALGAPPSGRIMGSLASHGGLAGMGGLAGQGGGLAG